MGISSRNVREIAGGMDNIFAGIAIDPVSRRGGKVRDLRWPGQPVGKEGGHHMIAHGKIADAVADRLDHARSIRHRNAAIFGRGIARYDAIIMIIERAGMDAHPHLARLRRAGIGQVDQLQIIERGGTAYFDGFHGVSFDGCCLQVRRRRPCRRYRPSTARDAAGCAGGRKLSPRPISPSAASSDRHSAAPATWRAAHCPRRRNARRPYLRNIDNHRHSRPSWRRLCGHGPDACDRRRCW